MLEFYIQICLVLQVKTKIQFKLLNPGMHHNTVLSICLVCFQEKHPYQHFHKLM